MWLEGNVWGAGGLLAGFHRVMAFGPECSKLGVVYYKKIKFPIYSGCVTIFILQVYLIGKIMFSTARFLIQVPLALLLVAGLTVAYVAASPTPDVSTLTGMMLAE